MCMHVGAQGEQEIIISGVKCYKSYLYIVTYILSSLILRILSHTWSNTMLSKISPEINVQNK